MVPPDLEMCRVKLEMEVGDMFPKLRSMFHPPQGCETRLALSATRPVATMLPDSLYIFQRTKIIL